MLTCSSLYVLIIMTDESSFEGKLEQLFEQMSRRIFSFNFMAEVANYETSTVRELPFSTFCKAADCLVKACVEVDIRVRENYLNVMKRIFFMVADFNEAMRHVYKLGYFSESPGGVPELRFYYKSFDVEMTRIVNNLTEITTFAVNPEVDNSTRNLAFLLLIAPKPAIRQLLVFMIQSKPLWPSVMMMLDRIPAFFELRIPTLKSRPKECSDILIIMFFRRLLNVERDVIDMTSAADHDTLQALILAFTRTQFGAAEVVVKRPLVGATDLLRDFIMHYLAESIHVDFFLGVLSRMFRVHDCERQWVIKWADVISDDKPATIASKAVDNNAETAGDFVLEPTGQDDAPNAAKIGQNEVDKESDSESDAKSEKPVAEMKDDVKSINSVLASERTDHENSTAVEAKKEGDRDEKLTAEVKEDNKDDEPTVKVLKSMIETKNIADKSTATVEPFALLSLLIEKHAESEEGSETRNLIPVVIKALASKFSVDGVRLAPKSDLLLEKLAPFDWSLRFCVCRWLKESIYAMGSKIPIPNVLYESLAHSCRLDYVPIESTFDCSETENFIRCIFELALTCTSEALDFINNHKFGLLPTRVYSPMIADALLRSIRVQTSINTLLKLRPVIESLFALLDVPVKQRCGSYHTERMFNGMRKLAPVLVLFEALFIYIKDNLTGDAECLNTNDLSHDARILLDTFTQSAIVHVNETYLKLKTTTVVFKTDEFGSHSESELVAALSEIGLLFTNIAYLAEKLQPVPKPLKVLKAELSQLARQLHNKVYPPYAEDICRYVRPTSCSSLHVGAAGGSTSAGDSDARPSADSPKKPKTDAVQFEKEWRKKRNARRTSRHQSNNGGGGGVEKFGGGGGGGHRHGSRHNKKRSGRSREGGAQPNQHLTSVGQSAAVMQPRTGSRHNSSGAASRRQLPEDEATGAFLA